ncbi:MAG: hypothetical protein QXW97_01750 [Candidatus Pacearchaeota archaeon]
MAKSKDNGVAVKIDFSLFSKIEEIMSKEENKYKFVNKKQFIDLAVNEFIKNLEKEELKKKK